MRLFVLILLLVLSTAAPARAVTNTARTAPTFNGTVHAVAYLGTTVYVGGSFTRASWGGRNWPRERLAAFDSRTGALLRWSPTADGTVRALATAPGAVYVAGDFHRVAGKRRDSIARLHPTGNTISPFRQYLTGTPHALVIGNGRLYLGGAFTSVSGHRQTNLAAFSLATGRLDARWHPATDGRVHTLAAVGGRIFLGGAFTTVNGDRSAARLAAVDAGSGTLDRHFRPTVTAEVNDIAVDGTGVYAATGGQGGRAIAYGLDGRTRWQRVFDGDTTAVTLAGGTAYVGGHFDRVCLTARNGPHGSCLDGSVPRVKLAAITAAGRLTEWNPQANGVIGVRVLGTDPATGALDAGGDFTTIGGRIRPRFARF
ncbi:hypothetical protein [Actinoplanes derwentensis]|uniref:PQQ-like domain-containing protein n=1 Tax=Actinoplanes derwentensis TaxID=113562 RepID=A0A1H2CNW5_9ACTN|nr:hypothetical protein [Actinoplanes derwentensis]GID88601.1 hypothetical protein Ade03nite_75250 [Actinoplanes derwentensis]SDT71902.1 hypothetical protein SAMN04489716_6281 [Actinoplanes derwentensis]